MFSCFFILPSILLTRAISQRRSQIAFLPALKDLQRFPELVVSPFQHDIPGLPLFICGWVLRLQYQPVSCRLHIKRQRPRPSNDRLHHGLWGWIPGDRRVWRSEDAACHPAAHRWGSWIPPHRCGFAPELPVHPDWRPGSALSSPSCHS